MNRNKTLTTVYHEAATRNSLPVKGVYVSKMYRRLPHISVIEHYIKLTQMVGRKPCIVSSTHFCMTISNQNHILNFPKIYEPPISFFRRDSALPKSYESAAIGLDFPDKNKPSKERLC